MPLSVTHSATLSATGIEGTTRRVAASTDQFIVDMQLAVDHGNIAAAIESYDISVEKYYRDVSQANLIGIQPDYVHQHYALPMAMAASIINTALDNKYPTPAPHARVRATYRRSY